jgi:hypothetical protein
MAITSDSLWTLVQTEEKWWKRIDVAVARWMNEILTEADTVTNHKQRLTFVLQVPKKPRPYTHLIKWAVSGGSRVLGATDPLDPAEVTDQQVYNEVKVIMNTLAVAEKQVRAEDEDPSR